MAEHNVSAADFAITTTSAAWPTFPPATSPKVVEAITSPKRKGGADDRAGDRRMEGNAGRVKATASRIADAIAKTKTGWGEPRKLLRRAVAERPGPAACG